MSTPVPSWLPASGRVAVHDVNSRYLFYYTSDPRILTALFQNVRVLDIANQCLRTSSVTTAADARLPESTPAIFLRNMVLWWKSSAIM